MGYFMRVAGFFMALMLPVVVRAGIAEPQPWQVETGIYQCQLKQEMGETEKVAFVATAGKSLELHLSSPWRNRILTQARLYQKSAPWKAESRQLLETLTTNGGVTQAVFDREAASLLGHMTTGGWGLLQLTLQDAPAWQVSLSSVGIKDLLSSFNDCRNRLPTDTFDNKRKTAVYFDSGSTRLNDDSMVVLDDLARYLLSDSTVVSFQIDGHTDRTGNSLENLELSRQRAASVRDYLLGQGISREMLAAMRHHGLRYPLTQGRTLAERRLNRRVEIVLSKSKSSYE